METVSFATANRGACPERVSYAYQMLLRGHSYQSAALNSGLSPQTLRKLCPPAVKRPDDPVERILSETCARYGITRRDLLSGGSERRTSYPRQEACARLWREQGMKHEDIGKLVGRHLSTICTSIQRYDERKAWAEVILVLAGSVHNSRAKTDRVLASSPHQKLQITGIF